MVVSLIQLVLLMRQGVTGLENGLARTPPMGWMSWQRFGCELDCKNKPDFCLSEQLIKRTADALVTSGLRDAGFTYIHIDDCWLEAKLDAEGKFVPDRERFPSGMKNLADYVHRKGLKLGIYTDIGAKTCAGYPGLGEGFEKHAETLAEWEIDGIKVDGCYTEVKDMHEKYVNFGRAVNKTNRPILYSCSWPAYTSDHCENERDLQLLKSTCNLWRNFDDIEDSWKSVQDIVSFFSRPIDDPLVEIAGPGGWNDPDMLLIGNPGLSFAEQQAQYVLWTVLAAPLYLSTEVANLTSAALALLLNPEIIAVSQDPLGHQGYVVHKDHHLIVFARPLNGGNYAVVYVNFASAFGPRLVHFDPATLGWPSDASVAARDLLEQKNVPGNFRDFLVDESSFSGFLPIICTEMTANPVLVAFMTTKENVQVVRYQEINQDKRKFAPFCSPNTRMIVEVLGKSTNGHLQLFHLATHGESAEKGGEFEVLRGECSVTMEDVLISELVEYQFDEDGKWRIALVTEEALQALKRSKFKTWEEEMKKPACEAAFRRLLQAGPISKIFDKHMFPTPSEYKSKYQVVNDTTGKLIDLPHEVAKLRIYDASIDGYREIDAILDGAPRGREEVKQYFERLIAELKEEYGADYVETLREGKASGETL